MSTVFYAIAPIFALIFVGYGLRRMEFPGQGFWPVSERLTYYVLFPALLIKGLSGRTMGPESLPLAASLVCAILVVALLTRLLLPLLKLDGPAYTSVFQGAFRPNTYVGLSVAAAMLGPDWMTLSAVALLVMIPTVNILCVLVLSHHGRNGGGGVGQVVRELAKNPLLLACVAGFILNFGHIALPRVLAEFMDILGRAALPMGLLAAGAGLRFQRMDGGRRSLVAASVLHLAVLPMVAAGLCHIFGGDHAAVTTAVIYTAIPVSVSSFILARQMGGDHRLMAQIITVQTVVSAFTMPVALYLLG